MKLRRVTVQFGGRRRPNPQKSADQISDRAKRYRANKKGTRPAGPKQCGFCGSRRNVGVGHVSGDESDGDPQNLMWTCKSCNAKQAHLLKNAGLGRRVQQMNPRRFGSKRAQMDAYAAAIKVMRGEFDGDVGKAVATIRSTPASVRSAFTSRSWPIRRQKYGPSGRQTDLPF